MSDDIPAEKHERIVQSAVKDALTNQRINEVERRNEDSHKLLVELTSKVIKHYSELKSQLEKNETKRLECQVDLKQYVHDNFYDREDMDNKFKIFVYTSVISTIASLSSAAGLIYIIMKVFGNG